MQSSSQSDVVGKSQSILKHNHPALRQVCPPFEWDNPRHRQDLADLKATLLDTPRARGLAAPQVGFLCRVFVMRFRGDVLVCANPKVVQASGITSIETEECMSFPNLYVKVQRPLGGRVSFETDGASEALLTMSGWDFRCFLHELDHINGITIDLIRRKQKA